MSTQRIIGFFLFCLVIILPGACHKTKPAAPVTEGFDPPILPVYSYLAGPLTFKITDLEDKINKALKPTLVTEEMLEHTKGVASLHLRVVRTGRVKIKYANGKVMFSAPLQVWMSMPIRFRKPKESFCSLYVNFQSPLQVGNTWRLATKSTFVDYTWIQKPAIRILGIRIPVMKIADKALVKHQADIEAALDEAIHKGLRLDQLIKPVWRDLQKPLLISQPYGLWLLPKPISVAAGEVRGNASSITVPLRIAFETKTYIGEQAPVFAPSLTLPHLLKRDSVAQTSDLRVLSFVPYADLNAILKKTIKNKKLSLIKGLLTIKDVSVYGGQHALVVKTDVSGAVNGTLYFRGQPAFDTLSYTLKIKNLDFDVKTQETLMKTADWLLHDNLRDTLQALMRFPMREQIAKLPGKIELAFAKGKAAKKTDLDIQTFRFVPQQVAIRPDGIQALIKVESQVAIKMKKL